MSRDVTLKPCCRLYSRSTNLVTTAVVVVVVVVAVAAVQLAVLPVCFSAGGIPSATIKHKAAIYNNDDEVMLNVLRCQLT